MHYRAIIAGIIIAAGATMSIWVVRQTKRNVPVTPGALTAQIKATFRGDAHTDSDGDGLFDWEEEALATDPNNPDTDKDGYLDGEEIASGYSPLRYAPNDQQADAVQPRPLPKTLLAAVARGVAGTVTESVAQAIAQKSSGAFKDPREVVGLLDSALPDEITRNLGEVLNPVIDSSRFSIQSESSKEKRDRYLLGVMALMAEMTSRAPAKPKTQEQVIAEAIEKLKFEDVLVYRDLYQETEKRLYAMPVPVDLVSLHQEVIAIMHVFQYINQAVSEFQSDPLKTTVALQAYLDIRPRFDRFAELLARAVAE